MKVTANFVRNVTQMWHILNITSASTGIRLNDTDRELNCQEEGCRYLL